MLSVVQSRDSAYKQEFLRQGTRTLLAAGLLVLFAGAASAEDGFMVYPTKEVKPEPAVKSDKPGVPDKPAKLGKPADTNEGVTHTDFSKLLDNSLGDNFENLIVVQTGCFTGKFSQTADDPDSPPGYAKPPKAGGPKKKFASLAATAKDNPRECAADF